MKRPVLAIPRQERGRSQAFPNPIVRFACGRFCVRSVSGQSPTHSWSRLFRMSLVLAVAIAGVPLALAQGWKPSRSVEFVVGAGSGGGNDRTARVIQKILQDRKLKHCLQGRNMLIAKGNALRWSDPVMATRLWRLLLLLHQPDVVQEPGQFSVVLVQDFPKPGTVPEIGLPEVCVEFLLPLRGIQQAAKGLLPVGNL